MTLGLTWAEARQKTGLEPHDFSILARSGAFRRVGVRFDPISLEDNGRRAIEIQRDADDRIKEIRRDAARRLAALGAKFGEGAVSP